MSELIDKLNDAALMAAAQDKTISDLRAQNEVLKQKLIEANVLPLPVEPLPPLPVYDTYEDFKAAGWTHYPDTPAVRTAFNDEWMVHGIIGGAWPPEQDAIIRKHGELVNIRVTHRPLNMNADWDAICHYRCLDVTDKVWASIVQEGDDSHEDDIDDIEVLVRNYSGGLRQPLDMWPAEFRALWEKYH